MIIYLEKKGRNSLCYQHRVGRGLQEHQLQEIEMQK